MSHNISGELYLGESRKQELFTGVEHAFFKYPQDVGGVELHAPFIHDNGLWRPVVGNSSNLTTRRKCEVSLSHHAFYGPEINLRAVDGVIGRPLLGLDNKGSFDGDFGDNGCNEAFTEFSLSVSVEGLAKFQGTQPNRTKKIELHYVTSTEMYKFGVAIIDAIDIHQFKHGSLKALEKSSKIC